jgi:hypothetical protein
VVVRMRWRVGIDIATGAHVLIKRYRPLEHRGNLEALYNGRDFNYLWRLEPPKQSAEPSRQEVEAALKEIARSRDDIRAALVRYQDAIRQGLARNDKVSREEGESVLDDGLPADLREKLFAIRGHLAGVAATLNAEDHLRQDLDRASDIIEKLELLTSWANRAPDQEPPLNLGSAEWERLQEQAAEAIEEVINSRSEALLFLPPDFSRQLAEFPAFEKDLIVHILTRPRRSGLGKGLQYVEEAWQKRSFGDVNTVLRTVSIIDVDSQTGMQRLLGGGSRHYNPSDGSVEEIYERYGGQDIPIASAAQ